jgi:hypothetical protein
MDDGFLYTDSADLAITFVAAAELKETATKPTGPNTVTQKHPERILQEVDLISWSYQHLKLLYFLVPDQPNQAPYISRMISLHRMYIQIFKG